ncbi:TnsA endonuclease N-terminal domain-containing protein [Sulfurimonas paralvinellae]|uniref:TnsA endonuclease N-terminal domain-containing protein n=1 Tax=Sulfurimonas paralvinellae TaxID=317658 RepID=A0A7M1B9R5_9BACT|nr:TnsA endonuclease N-terminal domain-containing protein [Sulfurimonas paralvinellae]QOP46454.1 hypothetical protein FM071_09170 [Sulfurimonas paralvinellae]
MITFPQRKIKKNYRSVTGHFPSIKNGKSVAYESKLEKTFFLTLEFDDNVISYQEQPQISIDFQKRIKTYSADCYVRYDKAANIDDSLVEVKYTQELEKKKEYFEEKFASIRQACDDLNLDFQIFTEQNYPQVYIDNLDFLYRYKTHGREKRYDNQILSFNFTDATTASKIANTLTNDPKELIIAANAIWGLVAAGKLTTDLHNTKVSMYSIIEPAL